MNIIKRNFIFRTWSTIWSCKPYNGNFSNWKGNCDYWWWNWWRNFRSWRLQLQCPIGTVYQKLQRGPKLDYFRTKIAISKITPCVFLCSGANGHWFEQYEIWKQMRLLSATVFQKPVDQFLHGISSKLDFTPDEIMRNHIFWNFQNSPINIQSWHFASITPKIIFITSTT